MPEPDDPCGARGGAGWICQLAAGHDGGHLQAVPEYSVWRASTGKRVCWTAMSVSA